MIFCWNSSRISWACRLCRPECIETTSLGAAYLAGLATGYWKNTDDIISNWQINNIFRPDMDEERRQTLIDGWHRAVKCHSRMGEIMIYGYSDIF